MELQKASFASIWEDEYCEPNGDDPWWCLQHNTSFKSKHMTMAPAHFAKKNRIGIKTFPVLVPVADLIQYIEFDSIVGNADVCKCGNDALMNQTTVSEYNCLLID